MFARESAVDVAQANQFQRTDFVRHKARINRGDLVERAAERQHFLAAFIKETHAERGCRAAAEVIGRAAAEAEQNAAHAESRRSANHLPDAVGRGQHGIGASLGKAKSRRLGKFDDGGVAVDHPDPHLCILKKAVFDGRDGKAAAACRNKTLRTALPAVRDRQTQNLREREFFGKRVGDNCSRVGRTDCPFIGIGCYNKFHAFYLLSFREE